MAMRSISAVVRRTLRRPFSSSTSGAGDAFDVPVAFLGLGAMGNPMAANLRSRNKVVVWNRTREVAEQHSKTHGTVLMSPDMSELANVKAVFLCLPTSAEVDETLRLAAPMMSPGTAVVDCTSGHPQETRRIAAWLKANHGVDMVDCAVSGGPGGARKGTLAAFVGCDDSHVVRDLVSDIETFAEHIVHLGPVGAGHAVKAINNAMNVSNLLCATEGLLALRRLGIEPNRALAVINKSSGRSLMSEQRIPEDVVTRLFDYGFKLGLMRKDVGVATDLLDENFSDATIIYNSAKLLDKALSMPDLDFDSDYTEVIKTLEQQAGCELRSTGDWEWRKRR